jgi:hypothetical protein
VRAIAAHGDATLTAGPPSFVGGKFVRGALFMGCTPAFAGDSALARLIHRREPPPSSVAAPAFLHGSSLRGWFSPAIGTSRVGSN